MNMKCFGEFPVEEILPLIGFNNEPKKFQTEHGVYRAGVSSNRLLCFKRSIFCVSCGVAGTHFHLEQQVRKSKGNHRHIAHINLYHIKDDKKILMTKDHIIPVSYGGTGDIENLQTMCAPCNNKKGNAPDIYSVRCNNELVYIKAFTKQHALTVMQNYTDQIIQVSVDDVQLIATLN